MRSSRPHEIMGCSEAVCASTKSFFETLSQRPVWHSRVNLTAPLQDCGGKTFVQRIHFHMDTITDTSTYLSKETLLYEVLELSEHLVNTGQTAFRPRQNEYGPAPAGTVLAPSWITLLYASRKCSGECLGQ